MPDQVTVKVLARTKRPVNRMVDHATNHLVPSQKVCIKPASLK